MSFYVANAQTRKTLAAQTVAALAALVSDDFEVIVSPEEKGNLYRARRRMVVMKHKPSGASVAVDFEGAPGYRRLGNTWVLSWHGVRDPYKFSLGFAPSVNRFHQHKATDIGEGFESMLQTLLTRVQTIDDGSAFEKMDEKVGP